MTRPAYELSDPEFKLLKAVRAGSRLTLSVKAPDWSAPDPRLIIRARVLRDLLLGRWVDKPDPGGVRLEGAFVAGALDLADVRTQISLHLLACTLAQTAQLYDCRLPQLVLQGSRISGLEADRLQLESSLTARRLITRHPIRLRGARIGGQLLLTGARMATGPACALQADGIRVEGDVLLRNCDIKRDTPSGDAAETGLVCFSDAQIGGCLDADNARLVNAAGPAFTAERAQVTGDLCLRGAEIEGSGPGAVVLTGAHIGAQLSFSRSPMTGSGCPALVGDSLHVAGNVFLDKINAAGSGESAVVRLVGARVEGSLTCEGGRARRLGPPGLALDLSYVTVGKILNLPLAFAQPGASGPAMPSRRPGATGAEAGKIALDGLTYPGVPDGQDSGEWLSLLRNNTSMYAAQPYRQLAAAYMAAGREGEARKFLIAQQDDLLARGEVSGASRLRHWVMRVTLGYGYQSWRALAWLGLTVSLAVIFVLLVCAPAGLAVQKGDQGRSGRCPVVAQIGLGFDLAIPLAGTATSEQCGLVSTRTSTEWEIGITWIFQALGWALTTLFIAGYTGLVRKTG